MSVSTLLPRERAPVIGASWNIQPDCTTSRIAFSSGAVGGLRDTFNVKTTFEPSLLVDLLALNPGRSVAATVRSHVSESRVAQMLDHFTQYVGSAPDASPAVLCGIANMQTSEGVGIPWEARGPCRAH